MRTVALIAALALVAGAAQADKVYKVTQPDGTVEFTDAPPPDEPAKEVDIPPLNTATPVESTGAAQQAASPQQGYTKFRITSPDDNAAIRDNAGSVDVDLSLEPPLRSSDTIDITLDGRVVGGGKKTAIKLTNVNRGTHSLQAVVKDGSGKVVAKSNAITFSLQRRSAILQPAKPRPAPTGG